MKCIFLVTFELIGTVLAQEVQKVECAKGFLTRRGESDLISDTNASPPASGVPLWLQMPRMCGTNPKDLVRFPPPTFPRL